MAGGRQGTPDFDPQRLRSAREAAELSLGALAEAAHVHISSIRAWEAGRQIPRVETVAVLAHVLDVSPADLLRPREGSAPTLQQLRAAVGKSQQQLAEAAGMLRNTYSAVERGETGSLSYVDTQALAAALEVSPEQVQAAQTSSRTAHLRRHPRPDDER